MEPDGTAHLHDKDQPSFWENNYYSAGSDDGVVQTSLGPIGLANGFEWGRARTAERMLGRVRLLAGGMHFPSFPTWKVTTAVVLEPRPPGAAAVRPGDARPHGADARRPGGASLPRRRRRDVDPAGAGRRWPTICVGETRICDADGVTLGRLSYEDGEG